MADEKGRASGRAKDWTGTRRARFLEQLAASANVSGSARAVGMSESSARRLRAGDPQFAQAWAQALRDGYERLELMLLQRAIAGAKPEVEGPMAAYSDGLALKLLEAHRKTVGAGPVSVPVDAEAAKRRLADKLDEMAKRARGEA